MRRMWLGREIVVAGLPPLDKDSIPIYDTIIIIIQYFQKLMTAESIKFDPYYKNRLKIFFLIGL